MGELGQDRGETDHCIKEKQKQKWGIQGLSCSNPSSIPSALPPGGSLSTAEKPLIFQQQHYF